MGDPRLVPEAQTRSQSDPWAPARAPPPSSHRIPEPLRPLLPAHRTLLPPFLHFTRGAAGPAAGTSGRGGAGLELGGGVAGGRSRGKAIAAVFLEAQPLFSNSGKKKKTQAFQGPVLLADRGDATPPAGSLRASLTRSAAGSPSPRSRQTEGAFPRAPGARRRPAPSTSARGRCCLRG